MPPIPVRNDLIIKIYPYRRFHLQLGGKPYAWIGQITRDGGRKVFGLIMEKDLKRLYNILKEYFERKKC